MPAFCGLHSPYMVGENHDFQTKAKKYKYSNNTIAATTRINDICVGAQIGNCRPDHALPMWRSKCGHNAKCCLIEFQFR